jgi:hypothetical protein
MVLIVATLGLVLPVLLGLLLAQDGDGSPLPAGCLGSAGATALIFTGLGVLLYVVSRVGAPKVLLPASMFVAAGPVLVALGLVALGFPLAAGACAVALVQAVRARRHGWFVALLVTAALPLLATIAAFALDVLVLHPADLSRAATIQLDLLPLLLPPVGAAGLTTYGTWTWWAARSRREGQGEAAR